MYKKEIYKTDTLDFTDTIKSVGTGGQVPTSKLAAGMLHSRKHQALGAGEGFQACLFWVIFESFSVFCVTAPQQCYFL